LTVDAGVALIHFICLEWVKNVDTSTLAFDIAQFFLSLNHQLFPHIFNKVGLILRFFQNYLVGRKAKYVCNSFSSSFFNVDIGVGQGLALSPILFAFYITLILHIFEN